MWHDDVQGILWVLQKQGEHGHRTDALLLQALVPRAYIDEHRAEDTIQQRRNFENLN